MVNYLIKPYDEVITYKVTNFSVSVTNLVLKQSANITTSFFDETGTIRRQEFAVLDGIDYINWTNDDYLLNWVCTKYGLVMLKG